MGAHFNLTTLNGKLTVEEVKKAFKEIREKERIEYGTDPYNGSFSTLNHITVYDKIFNTHKEAAEFCGEHSNKWENAVAVKAKNVKTNTIKKPTFNGKTSSFATEKEPVYIFDYNAAARTFVPADQLTDNQKDKLSKLFADLTEAKNQCQKANSGFKELVAELSNPEAEFKNYTELRKSRAEYVAANKKYSKIKEAFEELQKKYREKLYKYEEVDEGVIWVLGGWCAS